MNFASKSLTPTIKTSIIRTNSGDQNASAASVKAEPKNLRFSTKEPTVINSYKGINNSKSIVF